MTAGEKTFTGEWLDTPLAREISTMFPLTAILGRYGGREYYGSLPSHPTETEEGQLHFKNGDITYYPSNNTIAIFYAKANNPNMGTLTMRIIPIGKVTSDLETFDEMESRLYVLIKYQKTKPYSNINSTKDVIFIP
ncbi:cyclophilin-like fold protein [uncultured Bacteroides sp.]|uniref:cyclophilin-like fold protein n=1 Tax=uncultured Bacteroides sp. TaxID=162156 RepID=UPI0025D16F1B|nr:cyclophilin-like fold protein [uncultured Bacteroides sp.]